jgi:hypothetical protein
MTPSRYDVACKREGENGTAHVVVTVTDTTTGTAAKPVTVTRENLHDAAARVAGLMEGATAADVERQLNDELADRPPEPAPMTFRELAPKFPHLRRPVIHEIIREGESANVISGSKGYKSHVVVDMGLSVATGRMWLGRFKVEPGNVLLVDNELHGETLADRVPKIARARGIVFDEYADRLHIESLRGRLRDILAMESYFGRLEPGRFKLIILDALYRMLPTIPGAGENDNALMTQVYNAIDRYADRLGCAFVIIHHGSKGPQGGKAITDVGSGAGAQSRACDTHVVIRPHEDEDCAVMEAALRSWPPLTPVGVRWTYPVWTIDDTIDTGRLLREGRRRPKKEEPEQPAEPPVVWDVDSFVAAFLAADPRSEDAILVNTAGRDLSDRLAKRLLATAVESGKAHRWEFGNRQKARFSTIEQPVTATSEAP